MQVGLALWVFDLQKRWDGVGNRLRRALACRGAIT
jgi:hypothetical protein